MQILKEIADDQMKFVEAAGEWLAEQGQEFVDDACRLDDALWNWIASLCADSKDENA